MSDHLSSRIQRDYRFGRLDPSAMLAASDHLADCPACRGALEEIADNEPTYEQLAAIMEGNLSPFDRKAVELQIAESPAATAELEDLKRFKHEMVLHAGRIFGPEDRSVLEQINPFSIISVPPRTWRTQRQRLSIAAVAAAILLTAGLWAVFSPRSTRETALLTDGNGVRADLTALTGELRKGVQLALREARLETTAPAPELYSSPSRLAGPSTNTPSDFRPVAPLSDVVLDTLPTLQWTPFPGASAYVVTVESLDGADTRTSSVIPAPQTSWTLPEPLAADATYRWQVEALDGTTTLAYAPAPPAAEARFHVLSDVRRAELARVEAHAGRFPLVMAVAFAQAGLKTEAAAQLDILTREHPTSAVAKRLRHEAEAALQSPLPMTTKGAQ